MKIVRADNFDRGNLAEEFVSRYSIDLDIAKDISEYMNTHYCSSVSQYYYKVVEDDYKLGPGFQP